MKIAIVSDKSRATVLDGQGAIEENKQGVETVEYIRESLEDEYEVINLIMDDDIIQRIKEEEVDLVFNMCNGIQGEASLSQLPSFMEFANIPYTGSRPLGHGLAYDKIYSGKIFKASNIPTPKFKTVYHIEEIEEMDLDYPVFVKPKDEGSSRGITDDSLAYDKEALIEVMNESLDLYNPPIMIMEYIVGREFTIGVLGNGENLRILPIAEIDFSKLPGDLNKIFSFEAKFEFADDVTYDIPAKVDERTRKLIENTAIAAYEALDLRDYARIDVRLRGDRAYVLDINSLPGLDKNTSNICHMAYEAGMSHRDLIKEIVNMCKERM